MYMWSWTIGPGFDFFKLIRIRHTDACWFDGRRQNSKHYFILADNPL